MERGKGISRIQYSKQESRSEEKCRGRGINRRQYERAEVRNNAEALVEALRKEHSGHLEMSKRSE